MIGYKFCVAFVFRICSQLLKMSHFTFSGEDIFESNCRIVNSNPYEFIMEPTFAPIIQLPRCSLCNRMGVLKRSPGFLKENYCFKCQTRAEKFLMSYEDSRSYILRPQIKIEYPELPFKVPSILRKKSKKISNKFKNRPHTNYLIYY